MANGNVAKEDFEGFINTTILPAVEAFKVAEHQSIVGLLTYLQPVPRGQSSFRIPRIVSSTGLMERLGEYGRASYAKPTLEEIEFSVNRYGRSALLTEDAIAAAIESKVLDAIQNTVNDALRSVDRQYANDLMTVVMTGWADGTTAAPDYAGRTFAAHDHLVTNTAGGMTVAKIAAAKLLVAEHGYLPDTMMVSPDGEQDIVLMLAADNTGPQLQPPLVEGSIGRLYGLNIFVNPWVTDKSFVVVAANEKPIVFGQREAPELRSEFDALDRLWDAQIHCSFGFGVVKEFAGTVTVYKV